MSLRNLTPMVLCLCAFSTSATAAPVGPPPPDKGPASAAEARRFINRVDGDLKQLMVRSGTADWIKNTYITDDTERAAAAANEELLGYSTAAIRAGRRFAKVKDLDADTRRKLHLLEVSSPLAAPSDPARRLELTSIGAKLEGMYGKAKACLKGPSAGGKCLDIEALTGVLAKSRDYAELLDAWTSWHASARPMRPLYARYVTLANEGARDIGFSDTGALWRSSYDMTPEAFEKDAARLWEQVKPLYEQLHCYVRARLAQVYGADKVPAGQPIPAHLLGNMWAQEWTNVYPLVEPYQGQSSLDLDAALAKYTPVQMVKTAEGFFTSMGLDPLPPTFWERSMLVKPRDREVVCHASAWDVLMDNDLRIKVCIKPTEEDLVTLHHELGHDYYFHAYYKMPALYQQGANDGFHEAIGDALTLSITPAYLKKIGLLADVPHDDKGLINVQMKDALEKVAFLPFGKLIDEWRWSVYNGKIPAAKYNGAWWDLRKKYQGVAPAVARTEEDFDPGAKYHIPANVPYTRYFLARLLQFQFHRAMCRVAGHKGPLHSCSIYGNKQAGERLQAMLALGASKPWPDALEVLTGEREVDATALLDYFAPLRAWLEEKNKGAKCGW
jgi:peptidyl-dipeptidase A